MGGMEAGGLGNEARNRSLNQKRPLNARFCFRGKNRRSRGMSALGRVWGLLDEGLRQHGGRLRSGCLDICLHGLAPYPSSPRRRTAAHKAQSAASHASHGACYPRAGPPNPKNSRQMLPTQDLLRNPTVRIQTNPAINPHFSYAIPLAVSPRLVPLQSLRPRAMSAP